MTRETNTDSGNVRFSDGVGIMVKCSKGERLVSPGMHFRDMMTGCQWEVVEPSGTTSYSPSSFVGTPGFWCRAVGKMPIHAKQERADGCIVFYGDSIAAMLLTPNIT